MLSSNLSTPRVTTPSSNTNKVVLYYSSSCQIIYSYYQNRFKILIIKQIPNMLRRRQILFPIINNKPLGLLITTTISSPLPSSSLRSNWTNNDSFNRKTIYDKHVYNVQEGYDLKNRERGRVYHRSQPLWPSIAALEKDMTKAKFAPAERLPPELLPVDVAGLQLEGRIPDDVVETAGKLLKGNNSNLVEANSDKVNANQVGVTSSSSSFSEVTPEMQQQREIDQKQTTATKLQFADEEEETSTTNAKDIKNDVENDDDAMYDMESLAAMAFQSNNNNNELTPQQQEQKQSSSSTDHHQSRNQTILADLNSNDVSNPIASWSACGLDPVVEQRAMEIIGRGASRAQSRLLPALLNEDHNDVIFGSVTGSGKTMALLLAMIQGIRNESAGMNIFVCSDEINCHRVVSFLKKFEEYGMLDIADVKSEYHEVHNQDSRRMDPVTGIPELTKDWLAVGYNREDIDKYFRLLTGSLKPLNRTKRMFVCTADVLTELLFEHKLEFAPFGNLRRLYLDDVSKDIRFGGKDATFEMKQSEVTDPSATQLLLATVHQLMQPATRSLLQIAAVAADMETDLSQHLLALCVKSNHTLIACPSRLPSTLHCCFSFYPQHTNDKYEYLTTLLRNASPVIPGRVLIFFPSDVDLLQARATLMKEAGLEARLLFEVKADYYDSSSRESTDINNNNNNTSSEWASGWRYLLLHEHEGFGLDIPLVSHVVLTFCPSNRFSLQHIAGRAGRRGDPGWVFTILPRSEAQNISTLCKELDIDVTQTTVDVNLQNVDPSVVHRWTKKLDLWPLDPQFVVQERYQKYEDPVFDPSKATMFSQSRDMKNKDMMLEDYTPIAVLDRRNRQVEQLRKDIEQTPEIAVDMARNGLLDAASLKPTKKLLRMLDSNVSMPIRGKQGGHTKMEGRRERRREKGVAYNSNLTD